MKTHLRPTSAPFAFTLIELLTVIAIIAILMGLLFPALINSREAARVAQAGNDVNQIVAALKQYYTEYAKYPLLSLEKKKEGKESTEDESAGDLASGAENVNSAIFNTLRAIPEGVNVDHKMNPRKVVFFEGRSVKNPDSPKAGFVDKQGGKGGSDKGSFFDPWGKQYGVIIDTNYDNRLDVGKYYTDFSSEEDKPRTAVGAFSMGKDNTLGDNGSKALRNGQIKSDDIVSWQ